MDGEHKGYMHFHLITCPTAPELNPVDVPTVATFSPPSINQARMVRILYHITIKKVPKKSNVF